MCCFKLKNFYLFLFFLGTGLHIFFGLNWLLANGFCMRRAFLAAVSNNAGAAVMVDSLTCLVASIFFIISDGRRKRIAHYWFPTLLTFLIGSCAGLPLYLYMQEPRD